MKNRLFIVIVLFLTGTFFISNFAVQAAAKEQISAQNAGADDLLKNRIQKTNAPTFSGDTFLCDADGWAIGEPVRRF